VIECAGCGESKKHHAKGLCRTCYHKTPEVKERKLERQRSKYRSDPEARATICARMRDYQSRPETKARRADYMPSYHRMCRTGFTPVDFDSAWQQQGGLCAVCETDLSALPPRRVHADHCHALGAKRGLLCQKCNHGLGLFQDDPAILRRAADYLLDSLI
jgi:hypothetical protein